MNLTEMKEFAIFYVNEHKLSKADKNYLYNFIKEADADQLQHLLYTGEPKYFLDEQDLSYIQEVGGTITGALGQASGHATRVGSRYVGGGGLNVKGVGNIAGGGSVNANVAHGAAALAAAAVAALVARMAYKVYKDKISKIGKQCASFKHGTPDRKKCEAKAKNAALAAQMAAMKSGMSKCAKSKDPAKCKAGIQSKIDKMKSKMSPAV